MPEYLFVKYPLPRRVLVDGVDQGPVNELLELEAGQHTASLVGPFDFSPDQYIVWLANTDPLDPVTVSFNPK